MTIRLLPEFIDGYGVVNAYSGASSQPDFVQRAPVRVYPYISPNESKRSTAPHC